MLIEFSVTNFQSIREKQTLSLVAGKGSELLNSNTFEPDQPNCPRLLRSVVIYGPNGAGKSNFLKAFQFAQWFISNSATTTQEGQKIPITPFKLDRNHKNHPSEFEIIFIQDNIRYQYGFSVNETRVVREWLLAYPHGKSQQWFERTYDKKANEYEWSFSSKFKGEKNLWRSSTRSNTLFLSTAVQLNSEQLKPVFFWLSSKLIVIAGNAYLNPALTFELFQKEEGKEKLVRFMKAADISIEKFELQEDEMPQPFFPPSAGLDVRQSHRPPPKQFRILTWHKMTDSKEFVALNLEEESAGTIKLFFQAGGWLKALKEGATLVFDEMDNSLHPLIVRFLVNLFHDNDLNKLDAQLLLTTHDTSLLDDDIFRRDQVWFIEKDLNSSSHLYSLLDFSPRKDEALEKGYLKGRYGALPFVGPLKM
jgi:AAA15 family ATPase/GTPase